MKNDNIFSLKALKMGKTVSHRSFRLARKEKVVFKTGSLVHIKEQ